MTNNKKSTKFYSERQEKAIAKAIKGKVTAASGATKFNKGDVVTDDWLIEAKTSTTVKKSFTIKKQWLEKMREEQFACNKDYSALCFDFGDNKERFYVVDEQTFINCIKNKK